MWTLSRDRLTEYVLARPAPAEGGSAHLRFFDARGALDFLLGLPQPALLAEALRAAAWDLHPGAGPASEQALLERVACALSDGDLTVVARALDRGGGARRPEIAPRDTPADKPPPRVKLTCRWSRTKRHLLDRVELLAEVTPPVAGELLFTIHREGRDGPPLDELRARVTGSRVAVPWKVVAGGGKAEETPDLDGPGSAIDNDRSIRLHFDVTLEDLQASSGRAAEQLLVVVHSLHAMLVGDDGLPLGGFDAEVTLPDRARRTVPVGDDGVIAIDEIPGGSCTVDTGLPDRARVAVQTFDHPDNPPCVVRVPALRRPALPLPDLTLDELLRAMSSQPA